MNNIHYSDDKTIAIFNYDKYRKGNSGYYTSQRNKKTNYLHRDVWIYHNGKISSDCEVHHVISRDYNEIDGLCCMTEFEHKAHHILDRMDKIEEREYVCTNCNKTFVSKHDYKDNDKRFCGESCRKHYVHFNECEIRLCGHCGKEFSAHKHRPQKYCSRQCMFEGVVLKCFCCGQEIIQKSHKQKFCSTICADRYRHAEKTADQRNRICPHCNKEFIAKRTNQTYCCNICGQVERTKRYRIKNNKR